MDISRGQRSWERCWPNPLPNPYLRFWQFAQFGPEFAWEGAMRHCPNLFAWPHSVNIDVLGHPNTKLAKMHYQTQLAQLLCRNGSRSDSSPESHQFPNTTDVIVANIGIAVHGPIKRLGALPPGLKNHDLLIFFLFNRKPMIRFWR